MLPPLRFRPAPAWLDSRRSMPIGPLPPPLEPNPAAGWAGGLALAAPAWCACCCCCCWCCGAGRLPPLAPRPPRDASRGRCGALAATVPAAARAACVVVVVVAAGRAEAAEAGTKTSCPRALRRRMTRDAPSAMPRRREKSNWGLERRRVAAAQPVQRRGGGCCVLWSGQRRLRFKDPWFGTGHKGPLKLRQNRSFTYVPVPAAAASTTASSQSMCPPPSSSAALAAAAPAALPRGGGGGGMRDASSYSSAVALASTPQLPVPQSMPRPGLATSRRRRLTDFVTTMRLSSF